MVAEALTLMRRRDLMDGFLLTFTGACVCDAVRTADISIPANRQRLQKKGWTFLTQYGQNDTAREHPNQSRPPELEACRAAIREIETRREAKCEELRAELQDASDELKQRDVNRMERSYWRSRKKSLEAKLEHLASCQVTPETLYAYLVREDVTRRAEEVPPETRLALETLQRQQDVLRALPGN